jgi:hypothetical protein
MSDRAHALDLASSGIGSRDRLRDVQMETAPQHPRRPSVPPSLAQSSRPVPHGGNPASWSRRLSC